MDRLRIGVALYNSGWYLAAHEPLEALWLERPAGEREDYLQGLIQATAAVHKSRNGNEAGAAGLAESARGYLNGCGDTAVDALREWLGRLAADPTLADGEVPPELRFDGEVIGIYDLHPDEIAHAAEAVAETEADELLINAAEYVAADLAAGDESSPFVTLTLDYIRDPTAIVRQRLREHVERRRARESDVEGLFK